MEAKIEKTSELSKLLSVKTRMSDDLFHLFGKFGIGHLLSRLSLEKTWRGLGFASNLLTCPLVHSSTYHVTLSFIHPIYKQLVHWFTRLLVHLSTCLLVNKKTSQPCIFNKFCYICKLFNTYVSHVCWDYRYFILWV